MLFIGKVVTDMQIEEFSLRETKSARIKISLMKAFMDMLKKKRFDEISIKELCRKVEVSEPTFFKYFPEKIDVVGYYVGLLTQRAIGKALKSSPKGKILPSINSIFSFMAEELNNANVVVYQVISLLLTERERIKKAPITPLEMKLTYEDYEDGEEVRISLVHMDEFFVQALKKAVQNGELPLKTKCEEAGISLTSILIGTLFAVRFSDMTNCAYHYDRQLKVLWKSLGASI
jgi:AcrR family transcriptional regulator